MKNHFEKYARNGQAFVKRIAAELGDKEETSTALHILRATLCVLREHSTPEESIQFISQLPMFIKALYVDGWKVSGKKDRVRRLDDFVAAVQDRCRALGEDSFSSSENCSLAIQAVFRVIKEHVSEGEIEDLRRTLPEGLQPLLD